MAMVSWRYRGRIRLGRSIRSHHDSEDDVQLDFSREASENTREVLTSVCRRQGVTEGKRFSYLTAFIKLITSADVESGDLGYTIEEIQCCLRICLVHDATQVRAAALRAVRYLLKEERDVKTLYRLQYSCLIAKSLDLMLRNDMERVQALRLIRRLLILSPSDFPPSIVRSLVSLANGAVEEKDRMLRACLAVLTEICVVNPGLFIRCGGVSAVLRTIFDCSMPRIIESLCGVVLFLINKPGTRCQAAIRLEALAAPYCDFNCTSDRHRDERDARFHCSRLALLSVLRSWPGVLHFCDPTANSGLKALVGVLLLRQVDVRKAVLDLFYDLLGLPQPEWTDEFCVALEAVDPSRPQESWRLSEGFVAAEGRSILPHLAKYRPNIVEIHMSLLLYTFLEAGLLEALVEVIVSSDTFISVRATILLGELLQMIHLLVPPECCDLTPALPQLLSHAALGPDQRALQAVVALGQLHQLLKRRPAPATLFLDHLLQPGGKLARSRQYQLSTRDGEDALRDSGVLTHKDGYCWNWTVIRAILKTRSESLRKLDDSNHRTFLKRLVHYFKPSSNQFSRVDAMNKRQTQSYTLAGCELVDLLLEADEQSECGKFLTELVSDIWSHIDAITTSKSAHDCLFSPQHVANSLCQDYFLLIGRLSRSNKGVRVLDKAGIFQQLMDLVVSTNHDCYVKLVVSSLDYTTDGLPRVILSKALSGAAESSRLYATQFLVVLLRAGLPDFSKWGVELLVTQLYDQSKAVQLTAIAALMEATDDKTYLEAVIALRPSLLHLGDKGLLLLVRFLSSKTGFTFLNDAGFVAMQLDKWAASFNYRYVRIVEGELHDAMTLHRRGEDGRYSRRITSARQVVQDVLVPPHLYGQLAQHGAGVEALTKHPHLNTVVQCVLARRCQTDHEILELKAALWAMGHVATCAAGVSLVAEAGVLATMVQLAQGCPVYSIRGTAFFALGLVATTRAGAHQLNLLGWLCVRHHRHERWPVIEEDRDPNDEDDFESEHVDFDVGQSRLSTGATGRFYIPDEESDEGLLLDWPGVTDGEAGRKSATLPPTGAGFQRRHSRSRSESQPVENWFASVRTKDSSSVTPPTVVRERKPCSESFTDSSGVSSCDSVGLGKPSVNSEHQQTLSPIPSSTSLNTVVPGVSALHGSLRVSTREGSVSPRLSSQDVLGLATLRSLNRYRRPLLSDTFTPPGSRTRARRQTFSDSGCEFEAAAAPVLPSAGASSASLAGARSYYSSRSNLTLRGLNAATRLAGTDQCYMGITLPRDVARLFPSKGLADDFVLPAETDDTANDDQSTSDSEATESPVKVRRGDGYTHSHTKCLACCRDRVRDRKISTASSSYHRNRTDTESSYGGGGESPLLFPRRRKSHSASGCLLGNTPGGSVESGMSLDIGSSQNLAEESLLSRSLVRKEVLKHVERMANPVWGRQSRQALLQLKQRFPATFQDVCLYSDVCQRMGASTYRLNARRFLQELFLDMSFDVLYEEPASILQLSKPVESNNNTVASSTSSLNQASLSPSNVPPSRSPVNPQKSSLDGSAKSGPRPGVVPLTDISEEKTAMRGPAGDLLRLPISPTTVRLGEKFSVDVALTERSRTDPVPVVASNTKASTGFVVRSPPLEVVKEEPVLSTTELKMAFLFPGSGGDPPAVHGPPRSSVACVPSVVLEGVGTVVTGQKTEVLQSEFDAANVKCCPLLKHGRIEEDVDVQVMVVEGASGDITKLCFKSEKVDDSADSSVPPKQRKSVESGLSRSPVTDVSFTSKQLESLQSKVKELNAECSTIQKDGGLADSWVPQKKAEDPLPEFPSSAIEDRVPHAEGSSGQTSANARGASSVPKYVAKPVSKPGVSPTPSREDAHKQSPASNQVESTRVVTGVKLVSEPGVSPTPSREDAHKQSPASNRVESTRVVTGVKLVSEPGVPPTPSQEDAHKQSPASNRVESTRVVTGVKLVSEPGVLPTPSRDVARTQSPASSRVKSTRVVTGVKPVSEPGVSPTPSREDAHTQSPASNQVESTRVVMGVKLVSEPGVSPTPSRDVALTQRQASNRVESTRVVTGIKPVSEPGVSPTPPRPRDVVQTQSPASNQVESTRVVTGIKPVSEPGVSPTLSQDVGPASKRVESTRVVTGVEPFDQIVESRGSVGPLDTSSQTLVKEIRDAQGSLSRKTLDVDTSNVNISSDTKSETVSTVVHSNTSLSSHSKDSIVDHKPSPSVDCGKTKPSGSGCLQTDVKSSISVVLPATDMFNYSSGNDNPSAGDTVVKTDIETAASNRRLPPSVQLVKQDMVQKDVKSIPVSTTVDAQNRTPPIQLEDTRVPNISSLKIDSTVLPNASLEASNVPKFTATPSLYTRKSSPTPDKNDSRVAKQETLLNRAGSRATKARDEKTPGRQGSGEGAPGKPQARVRKMATAAPPKLPGASKQPSGAVAVVGSTRKSSSAAAQDGADASR